MKIILLSFFLLAGLPGLVRYAQAGGTPSIDFVFTPSLTSVRTPMDTNQTQAVDHDRKLGLGAGLLLDAPMTSNLSIGTGAIYIDRTFELKQSGLEMQRQVPTVFVPLELKLWFFNAIDIGGGGFAAVRVGSVRDTVDVGNTSIATAATVNRHELEWGWTVSAAAVIPVADRTGLTFGARYFYGITDAEQDSMYDEQIDDLVFTAGISIGIK